MLTIPFPADAFGDRFDISSLPPAPATGWLCRPAAGYRPLARPPVGRVASGTLPGLNAILDTFDAAFLAASQWVISHDADPRDHHLAIVPVGYDMVFNRPILIYGVLCAQP